MLFPAKKIICRHCLRDTGYTENSFTHYVIPPGGVKCPHCNGVIVAKREVFLQN